MQEITNADELLAAFAMDATTTAKRARSVSPPQETARGRVKQEDRFDERSIGTDWEKLEREVRREVRREREEGEERAGEGPKQPPGPPPQSLRQRQADPKPNGLPRTYGAYAAPPPRA